MGAFDDISLDWDGERYTIPANRVLGAIARIEDVITLPELAGSAHSGKMSVSKVSMAYGAVLRYAGASIEDDDVYAGMFAVDDPNEAVKRLHSSISTLLAIMTPPSGALEEGADQSGNSNRRTRRAQTAERRSSEKHSKRPADPPTQEDGDSARTSSGT